MDLIIVLEKRCLSSIEKMKLGKLPPVCLAGLPVEEGDRHMKSRQPASLVPRPPWAARDGGRVGARQN